VTWNLACLDWETRLRAGRSLIPDGLPLYRENADRSVEVFDRLKLADVPGNPPLRTAAGDWFKDITRTLHGALDPLTGERHIREVFCLTPKKQSKTTYGALLMLVSLLLNARPKALFLLVAPTLDVSAIAFSQIEGAIRLDPGLADFLHVQVHLKRVTDRRNNATLQVLSFDPSILTGQKHCGCLIDELHVVGSVAKAPSAIGQLRGGMVLFPESFLCFITTQSETAPSGVFRAELNKARGIRDGRITGKMLPVLYEFPEAIAKNRAAWSNPENWPMITPNRGRSITIDRLIEDFETAKESGEEEVKRWATQHLNVECGVGLHSDRWAGADHWQAAGDPTLSAEAIIARSDAIVVGVDGGGLDDLLGAAVLGRDRETRRWLLTNHAWAHTDVLERRKSEAGRLRDFARNGDLTIVDRLPADIDQLADGIARYYETGKLVGVALDQLGVGGIVEALLGRGIPREMIVPVSQGYKLTAAIKTTERKLADGTLIHSALPLMSWCVGNAKTEMRGNALLITKAASGTAKIDPLVATFSAVHLMMTSADSVYIYDNRDLKFV
jgi:phage terminase large subunit-like protein